MSRPTDEAVSFLYTLHGGSPALYKEVLRARSEEAHKDETLRAIGERLVAAGGTRDGTILEQLNAVLESRDRQIKALADALERTFEVALPGSVEGQIREALHSVGRLK